VSGQALTRSTATHPQPPWPHGAPLGPRRHCGEASALFWASIFFWGLEAARPARALRSGLFLIGPAAGGRPVGAGLLEFQEAFFALSRPFSCAVARRFGSAGEHFPPPAPFCAASVVCKSPGAKIQAQQAWDRVFRDQTIAPSGNRPPGTMPKSWERLIRSGEGAADPAGGRGLRAAAAGPRPLVWALLCRLCGGNKGGGLGGAGRLKHDAERESRLRYAGLGGPLPAKAPKRGLLG